MRHSIKDYIWLLSILLCSCAEKKSLVNSKNKSQRYIVKKLQITDEASIDLIRQQEAKLSDIPPPLYASPLPLHCQSYSNIDPESIVLGYCSELSSDEILTFYTLEMERLGWRNVAMFSGHELLLNFEKPGRMCTISIRPEEKEKTGIYIFAGTKEHTCV